jgi:hypothetical protein
MQKLAPLVAWLVAIDGIPVATKLILLACWLVEFALPTITILCLSALRNGRTGLDLTSNQAVNQRNSIAPIVHWSLLASSGPPTENKTLAEASVTNDAHGQLTSNCTPLWICTSQST